LRIGPRADPRIRSFQIWRHPGRAAFHPGEARVARVCVTSELMCVNRRVPAGTYRYAVLAQDEWASSIFMFSQKVVVRRPSP
jgi:hypothetical protein